MKLIISKLTISKYPSEKNHKAEATVGPFNISAAIH
jgi:hypothetical protein